MIRLFLNSIILLLLCSSCQSDGKRDIERFYLPLEELYDGLVYEYESVGNDTLPPYYWYFRTIEQEETTFLTGMYYNYNFTPQQFIREEQVSNGMLLEEMFLYETDSLDKQSQIPIEILSGSAFPFQVQDSLGVFLYKVKWKSPKDSSVTTIIRNRRYKRDVTIGFDGKSYKGVEFSLREIISNEVEGSLELELEGVERYAEGIGLVYSKRRLIGGGFEQVYKLVDRYPMSVLEERFAKQLQQAPLK